MVKQMKIIHQNGYSRDELEAFRGTVYDNLINSAKDLVTALTFLKIDVVDPSNVVCVPSLW